MELGVDFIFRPLQPTDKLKPFKSGAAEFQPLKTFLLDQAENFQTALVAQTFVCSLLDNDVDIGRIIAYITLTCSEIDIRDGIELADCPHAHRYDSMPALKIARLAVDSRYQRGHGLGRLLVDLAVACAYDKIAPYSGCRFLVTDAKRKAMDFYHKVGFTLLDTPTNHQNESPIMFLDLFKNLDTV
ncbi:GNAT family N-acetyltransferase [Shewanella oncorhynchi]|uniref:GNAT family N-acetyltransferase n=1 Tax=Shewanella oncorhynchi TaxID=2726434 RepID=UPI003D7BAD4D